MRRSRPLGPAAFTGSRLAPVLALIGACVVLASTTSVASGATFIKSWHSAPAAKGLAVGHGRVYVAASHHSGRWSYSGAVQAFTTAGDPLGWEGHGPSGACSVALKPNGNVLVGTCQPVLPRSDQIAEFNPAGRSLGSLHGFNSDYNGFSRIEAVAFVSGHFVYYTERNDVITFLWQGHFQGDWEISPLYGAKGLAPRPGGGVYALQGDHFLGCACRKGGPYSPFGEQTTQKWGGPGSGNGQLNGPEGIAVGGPHGNIYIADTGNNRIQEFTSKGVFLNAWTGPGPGGGSFSVPMDVGVDADGNVYVLDSGHNRVVKFTP
jgi:DNA-binding beta-propeller fold protein YncE